MRRTDDPVTALSAATEQMAVILAGVRERHLGLPTPCDTWDVADLVSHVVAGPRNFVLMNDGGTPDWSARPEVPLAQLVTEFQTGAEELQGSWRQRGDDADTGPAGFAAAEFAVHAWDLARATGQSVQLDGRIAESALVVMQAALTGENRGEAFRAAVAVSEHESAYSRLAAFSGRNPHRYADEQSSEAPSGDAGPSV